MPASNQHKKQQPDLWSIVPAECTETVETTPLHLAVLPGMQRTCDELFAYGKRHQFPECDFLIGSGFLGDFREGYIPAGEERWAEVYQCRDKEWLEKARANVGRREEVHDASQQPA